MITQATDSGSELPASMLGVITGLETNGGDLWFSPQTRIRIDLVNQPLNVGNQARSGLNWPHVQETETKMILFFKDHGRRRVDASTQRAWIGRNDHLDVK